MKIIFPFFVCMVMAAMLLPYYGRANNYYISVAIGDDSRTPAQAQNPATPWKTINPIKANYTLLIPGDSVLFRRGETHIASAIRPTVSGTTMAPIVWGAYDAGTDPVLTGATTLTGFTPATNPAAPAGVYQATLPNTNPVRLVFNSENRQPIGRQPNTGYWYVTGLGTNPKTMFKDANNLTQATNYWVGANVGIRFEDWEWWAASVTAFDATLKQITLNSASYNNLRSGWGYFFTNKLEIVDTAGEWYQDVTNKILYYYPPAGTDIAALKLDVANNSNAFFLRNLNYNQVVNLKLQKYSGDAIYVDTFQNASLTRNIGLQFKNVTTFYSYTRAIQLRNSSNTLIDNCTFYEAQYEGINIESCDNTLMQNSQVLRTGLVPGLQARAGVGIAFRPPGYNNRVSQCFIDSSGKHGITMQDSLSTVEKTVIKRSSLNTTDIGAIYLISPTCVRDTIRNCFVSETSAFFGGYPAASVATAGAKGRGLYVDDYAHDVWFEGNTSFNNSNYGIHLINGTNVTLRNNIAYNNGTAEINCQEANSRTPRVPAGYCKYDIQNNIFYAVNPSTLVMSQQTQDYNGCDFGIFNNNIYHHPTDSDYISLFYPRRLTPGVYPAGPTGTTFQTYSVLNLSDFAAFSGQEAASKRTKFRFPKYTITGTLSPNLIDNSNFEMNLSGWTNESAADFTMSQVTGLNGKALSFKSNNTVVNRKNFTYNKPLNNDLAGGDYCRLRYTLKTTLPYTSIRPTFAQNISPYATSGFSRELGAKTTPQTTDIVFQLTALQPSTVLKFTSSIDADEYLIDDVSLEKVSVTVNDISNRQMLLTNPSSSPLTVALNAANTDYFDLDSLKITSGSITVPAWSSRIVITMPSALILPIDLLSYEVEKKQSSVLVKWATSHEVNNDHFEIEYSRDGAIFRSLQSVAGNGTAASRQSYSYLHTTPVTGINYYRLVQVDKDGRRKTYPSKLVNFDGRNNGIMLYPSPATNGVTIRFEQGLFTTVELSDVQGKILETKIIATGDFESTFNLSHQSPGTYFIRLKGFKGNETKQFIRQ